MKIYVGENEINSLYTPANETDPIFAASAAYTITENDITRWNGKSDFNGNYNNLFNKPVIPTAQDIDQQINAAIDSLPIQRPFTYLSKMEDFLYHIEYDTLDYDYALDYFNTKAIDYTPAGCSVIRKDNMIARNLDWLDDYEAIFYVHTAPAQGRHETWGVAGGMTTLTTDFVESRQIDDRYMLLPFYLQDGRNDAGLFAEMNVVPLPTTPHTRISPDETQDTICVLELVRFVLDRFSTVNEAIDYLQNHTEIFFPATLNEMGYELHFMLSDDNDTKVIEFIDNEIVAIDSDKSTNFHLYGVDYKANGDVFTPYDAMMGYNPTEYGIDKYGTGLERWNILNAADDAREAIEAVTFSKAYDDAEPEDTWWSEFVGGMIDVDTPADDTFFIDRVNYYRQLFADHTKGDGTSWITTHCSIYDLEANTLTIKVQEKDTEHMIEFYPEEKATVSMLQAATEDMATKTWTEAQIAQIDFPETDLTNYATHTDVAEAIDSATADLVTYSYLYSYLTSKIDEIEIPDPYDDTAVRGLITNLEGEVIANEQNTAYHINKLYKAVEAIPEVDLTGYATEAYVTTALAPYATTSDVSAALEPYATESYVADYVTTNVIPYDDTAVRGLISNLEADVIDNEQNTAYHINKLYKAVNAIPEVDLTGYATESYVTEKIAEIPEVDLTGYATESYVTSALEGYATETYVSEKIDAIEIPEPYDDSTILGYIQDNEYAIAAHVNNIYSYIETTNDEVAKVKRDYATKAELPNTSLLATKNELNTYTAALQDDEYAIAAHVNNIYSYIETTNDELTKVKRDYATKAELPNTSLLATKTELNTYVAALQDDEYAIAAHVNELYSYIETLTSYITTLQTQIASLLETTD